MKIHGIISRLKESENIVSVGDANSSTCSNTTTESSQPKCRLELFYEDELSQHNSNLDPISVQEIESIKQQLANMCNRPRVSISLNVLDIWKVLKNECPELYNIATTILSAPSSQVSVERAFSALAIVLDYLRTNLKSETLNNILIIKLNYCLINKIPMNFFENL